MPFLAKKCTEELRFYLGWEEPSHLPAKCGPTLIYGRESTADFRPAVGPAASLRGPCGLRRTMGFLCAAGPRKRAGGPTGGSKISGGFTTLPNQDEHS